MNASRDGLTTLLTHAAEQVGTVLTAEYPAPGTSGRPYLAPLLGPLAAATEVLPTLSSQLDTFFTDDFPKTSAGLFTLASLAAATGWLSESTGEFISAIEAVCDRAGIPVDDAEPTATGTAVEAFREFAVPFTTAERQVLLAAAQTSGLEPEEFIAVSALALAASLTFTTTCREIHEGLLADAEYVRTEADTDRPFGTESVILPTLVQQLLDTTDEDA
ncbi:hypothetical protein ACFXJ5_09035 [Streptomyces sp. NPDC059373]